MFGNQLHEGIVDMNNVQQIFWTLRTSLRYKFTSDGLYLPFIGVLGVEIDQSLLNIGDRFINRVLHTEHLISTLAIIRVSNLCLTLIAAKIGIEITKVAIVSVSKQCISAIQVLLSLITCSTEKRGPKYVKHSELEHERKVIMMHLWEVRNSFYRKWNNIDQVIK